MNLPRTGFIYDCNNQALTVLQLLKCTFENPAGSGKKIIIEGYGIPNMGNVGAMATLIHMPTTSLPTTTYAPMPYHVSTSIASPGNAGIFKANVATIIGGTMSGGTSILTIPVKPADRNYIEGPPITLMPGTIMGFQLNSAIVMSNISFVIYTREEDIT